MKRFKINSEYQQSKAGINEFINNFDTTGINFGNQKRNSLKLFDLQGATLNIKSFKIPNIFNQIAYRFFRKSKAQRSFEYGEQLVSLGVGTPEPIAYYEFMNLLFFRRSFYVSKQLECDLTYRELITYPDYPDREAILRAFTHFTYSLHEKDINFLDHSPGNTLIIKKGDDYQFYLVDLNRMKFELMDFEARMKNFSRLTPKQEMIEIMSDEYSKITGIDRNRVFQTMWGYTEAFFDKFNRKQRLKKKYMFWRS